MEVTTTMVLFQLDKAQVETRTDKAVLLALVSGEQESSAVKEWVPLSKIEIEESRSDSSKVDCIMPKWLYYKKEVLPQYTTVRQEFIVTSYADKYELLAEAYRQQ